MRRIACLISDPGPGGAALVRTGARARQSAAACLAVRRLDRRDFSRRPARSARRNAWRMPVVIFTRDIVMRAVITDEHLRRSAWWRPRRVSSGGGGVPLPASARDGGAGRTVQAGRRGRGRQGGLRLHQPRYPARAAPHRERDQLPRLHRFPLSAGALPGALRKLERSGDVTEINRSVARLLAESLEAHDVDQIFCVPGESYVGLINTLTDIALAWHTEDLIDVVRLQAFRQQAGNGTGHLVERLLSSGLSAPGSAPAGRGNPCNRGR